MARDLYFEDFSVTPWLVRIISELNWVDVLGYDLINVGGLYSLVRADRIGESKGPVAVSAILAASKLASVLMASDDEITSDIGRNANFGKNVPVQLVKELALNGLASLAYGRKSGLCLVHNEQEWSLVAEGNEGEADVVITATEIAATSQITGDLAAHSLAATIVQAALDRREVERREMN